jgi:hypothetical protein
VAVVLVRRRRDWVRAVAFGGSAAASLIVGVTAAAVLETGTTITGTLFVHGASGFAVTYSVDALSACTFPVVRRGRKRF